MSFLKQSTSVTVLIGPFLDPTDGVTEETALTPAVEISKAGGAFASKGDATAPAHSAEGWYTCVLNATDTGTVGRLVLKAQDSANHLPVWHEFSIVPANVYDSLVAGTDYLAADALQVEGLDATDQIRDAVLSDATRFAGANIDAAITSRAPSTTALTNATWTDAKAGHIDAAISTRGTANAGDQMDLVDAPNATALTAFAAAAWNRLTSALSTVGSIGKLLVDNVDAAISGRSSHSANDARDAILSDATRFAGANVDAAITSRAATGEAAAAVGTLNDIAVADILGETIEGTYTLEQMLRIAAAALAGEVSGGGTATVTFQGLDGLTNRIVATVTTDGNRTNMVLDGS